MGQRIRYRFPKHETIDQIENVFVFESETYNVQEFAEAYAAGLYDVNRLQDRWKSDWTPDEVVTQKDDVTVFDGCNASPFTNMLKYVSGTYEGEERTYIDENVADIVSSTDTYWLRTHLLGLMVGLYWILQLKKKHN